MLNKTRILTLKEIVIMKQTTKNILGVAAVVLLSSGVGGFTAYKLLSKEKMANATFNELFHQNPNNVQLAGFNAVNAQPVDLTQAAENSVHAVVHIRATELGKTQTVQTMPDFLTSSLGMAVDSNARFRHSLV